MTVRGRAGEHVMNRESGTGKYERLLERCAGLEPVPTAVAHPCEETALAGAVEAAAKRLALFHHEPTYTDRDVQRMHRESIRYEELTRFSEPLEVICSYDGLELAL